MTTTASSTSDDAFGAVAVLTGFLGLVTVGYGLLLVPQSALGGGWTVAVGLSLVLSGVFATGWAGDRFGLSPVARRNLSLGFAAVAVVLLVAFVVLSHASFESYEASESGSSVVSSSGE